MQKLNSIKLDHKGTQSKNTKFHKVFFIKITCVTLCQQLLSLYDTKHIINSFI
jgi:hypothetical protein